MITHFADTSAILHQANLLKSEASIAISPITIMELEHIKEHENDNSIKYRAREAVRSIISDIKYNIIITDNKEIDKLLKKYSFLSNINDHRILLSAEAAAIKQGRDIIFITNDALQFCLAITTFNSSLFV